MWPSETGVFSVVTDSEEDSLRQEANCVSPRSSLKHSGVPPVAFTSDHIETLYDRGCTKSRDCKLEIYPLKLLLPHLPTLFVYQAYVMNPKY